MAFVPLTMIIAGGTRAMLQPSARPPQVDQLPECRVTVSSDSTDHQSNVEDKADWVLSFVLVLPMRCEAVIALKSSRAACSYSLIADEM